MKTNITFKNNANSQTNKTSKVVNIVDNTNVDLPETNLSFSKSIPSQHWNRYASENDITNCKTGSSKFQRRLTYPLFHVFLDENSNNNIISVVSV